VNGELREPRIPLKKYWKLLNASKSNLLIVVVILMIASQIVKAFGAWWISHVNHHHGKILLKHEHHNTRIFLQVISLFVVFHLVEGLISAYLSKTNSDSFSDTAIQSLARSEMRFFEEHDLIVVALKANKDFEDTFSIIYYFQTVLRNILLFLFTLFSISIEAPEFLIVGAFIAITAVVSYTLFSRTEREIMRYYTPTYEDTQKEFEQYIDGIESIKPLGKLERLRTIWDTKLHDLYVIKINEKYIYHALNIMMELITMTVVVVPALYAINNKRSLNEHDIHTFTILIVYSTKLTGLMSMILKDCAYVENMMRLSIKKNLDLIDLLPEKNPNSPSDDIFWPSSSSVKLENVTVSNQLYAKPELS
jgi:ABC-type multidrug transport system fused ATPase/permease subunit